LVMRMLKVYITRRQLLNMPLKMHGRLSSTLPIRNLRIPDACARVSACMYICACMYVCA
jgi:hypothetical protein